MNGMRLLATIMIVIGVFMVGGGLIAFYDYMDLYMHTPSSVSRRSIHVKNLHPLPAAYDGSPRFAVTTHSGGYFVLRRTFNEKPRPQMPRSIFGFLTRNCQYRVVLSMDSLGCSKEFPCIIRVLHRGPCIIPVYRFLQKNSTPL